MTARGLGVVTTMLFKGRKDMPQNVDLENMSLAPLPGTSITHTSHRAVDTRETCENIILVNLVRIMCTEN